MTLSPARPPRAAGEATEPAPEAGFPVQPLLHLDALWIQVAGTLCNLRCEHCFVSSGPGDDHHALMSRDEVRGRVAEGLALGVKEFYFTGGEPFVHPAMLEILEDTLAHGPTTVLTNGTLFTPGRVETLRRLTDRSRYALEVRVSLDGPTPAEHDALRGPGSFARALAGLSMLASAGLLPIVTVTRHGHGDPILYTERYLAMLRAAGIARPRLKLLPLFRLGRAAALGRGYRDAVTLAGLRPEAFDPERLQCGRCRAVTSQGVFVCPLLVDEPGGRMGDRLDQALGGFTLRHGACTTCWITGMTCANA